jgi:hypothetical protein
MPYQSRRRVYPMIRILMYSFLCLCVLEILIFRNTYSKLAEVQSASRPQSTLRSSSRDFEWTQSDRALSKFKVLHLSAIVVNNDSRAMYQSNTTGIQIVQSQPSNLSYGSFRQNDTKKSNITKHIVASKDLNARVKWEYYFSDKNRIVLEQMVREHAVSYGLEYTASARQRWQALNANRTTLPSKTADLSKIKRIWIWGQHAVFPSPCAHRQHPSPTRRRRRALLLHHGHHRPAPQELRHALHGPCGHQTGGGVQPQGAAQAPPRVRHRWPPVEARCTPPRPP